MNINYTLVTQVIVFFAFVGFCAKFIWPPLMGAIEARRNRLPMGSPRPKKAASSCRIPPSARKKN